MTSSGSEVGAVPCPPEVSEVLDSVRRHDDGPQLRRYLERVPRAVMEAWRDEDGLDLLHHSILLNNVVAVTTLFSRGYFKPPHEPPSFPYVHLACRLGFKTIMLMLMQERPHDNRPAKFNFRSRNEKQYGSKVTFTPTGSPASGDAGEVTSDAKLLQPLDIAAAWNHANCVRSLLDFLSTFTRDKVGVKVAGTWVKGGAGEDHLTLACRWNSPEALRLLLSEEGDGFAPEQLKRALDVALKSARVECVDMLLRRGGIDTRAMFKGMNLFHVLYAYSFSCTREWYENLMGVTSVLLRQRHDVLAHRPSRTYPLYSLLACILPASPSTSAPFVLAAMLLLLNSGADPNVDEALIEEKVRDAEHTTAFGRVAHASALHCVMHTVTQCAVPNEDVEKFMVKATEVLLRHHADPTHVGRLGDETGLRGNSLHALALASGHLGSVSLATLRLLLRAGADPDAEVDGRYPLVLFCEKLFSKKEGGSEAALDSSARVELLAQSRRLAVMLHYMSFGAIQHVQRTLLKPDFQTSATGESCMNAVRASIGDVMARGVWTLRRLCQNAVWRFSFRDYARVQRLPIPVKLQVQMIRDAPQ